jgi:chorismate mutase
VATATVGAVRGAVQVPADTPADLLGSTRALMRAVLERNGLTPEHVISVLFTTTPDLHSAFPAEAARALGLVDVPLICAAEISVPGAMERVVRLLAHVEWSQPRSRLQHVYLGRASALRPDLAQRGETRSTTWSS